MSRSLRVFGYMSQRSESRPAPNGGRQTREIMAAHSVAEVLRTRGLARAEFDRFGSETGNPIEIALAMSQPGVIFWRRLDDYREAEWHAAEISSETGSA